MAYSKEVVERFENVLANPEAYAVGEFDPKDATVATGMVGAPACGDVMKLDLKINSYSLFDLEEPSNLQNKYIKHVGLTKELNIKSYSNFNRFV